MLTDCDPSVFLDGFVKSSKIALLLVLLAESAPAAWPLLLAMVVNVVQALCVAALLLSCACMLARAWLVQCCREW